MYHFKAVLSSDPRPQLLLVGCITRTDDLIQAAGGNLGSNLHTEGQLVVSLFQDHISYGRFTGATLYVPCLD